MKRPAAAPKAVESPAETGGEGEDIEIPSTQPEPPTPKRPKRKSRRKGSMTPEKKVQRAKLSSPGKKKKSDEKKEAPMEADLKETRFLTLCFQLANTVGLIVVVLQVKSYATVVSRKPPAWTTPASSKRSCLWRT